MTALCGDGYLELFLLRVKIEVVNSSLSEVEVNGAKDLTTSPK